MGIAVRVILRYFWQYVYLLLPYLTVLSGFAAFIVWNKGIVVGEFLTKLVVFICTLDVIID